MANRTSGQWHSGTFWLLACATGWLVLPWSCDDAGFFAFDWLRRYPLVEAPASLRALRDGQIWLLPLAFILLPALPAALRRESSEADGRLLLVCCLLALAWLVIVAASVGLRGWTWMLPERLFGPLPRRNPGFGIGAYLYGLSVLALTSRALAARSVLGGNEFSATILVWSIAFLAIFVAYPLLKLAMGAFQTPRGAWAPELFLQRIGDPRIWRWGGPVGNTLLLGICSALASTTLALAFGLITERTSWPGRKLLRTLSILPIITPPFVVGLSVILLMGRNGSVNHLLEAAFGIPPTRWIYGFQGVWFAQTLSFTPVAYLVLAGVLQGMNPALEEAAQTMRARPFAVFKTVTLPLARPGLANAFLVVFAQSLADFGNPLLLGADFPVLATSIYFAVVGARADRGVAAVLGLILLLMMLGAFLLQRRILRGRSYTTISGKGMSGAPVALSRPVEITCLVIALAWAALTTLIYGAILFGGFVENWGLNHTLTLRHYRDALGIAWDPRGLRLAGQAWEPLLTTAGLALVAAPLTAIAGLALAHLVGRRQFRGRGVLEAGALASAAVPGTVLGIAYVLAFNNPPLELVQTAAIVVLSFIMRNMGPGMRAGQAGLAQIDRSLEEASQTLRANTLTTMRRVLLPLMKPMLLTALVHGFVAAMTTVSAVIFLVSPGLTLATVYIVNLAEAGTYGVAIATSSALLVMMLAVILLAEWLIGTRRLARRPAATLTPPTRA